MHGQFLKNICLDGLYFGMSFDFPNTKSFSVTKYEYRS